MFGADSYIKIGDLGWHILKFLPKNMPIILLIFSTEIVFFLFYVFRPENASLFMYTVSGLMTSIRKKKKRTENTEESLEENIVERRTKKLTNHETYLSFRMLWRIFRPE
jgi:hypothetical protein